MNISRLIQRLFYEGFHPVINMGIAIQITMFTIILLMEIWTLMAGCLAFYQHPQISHIMLCLSTGISIFATAEQTKYDVFISYSRRDLQQVIAIRNELKKVSRMLEADRP